MSSATQPQPDADGGIPERTLRHLEWARLQTAWLARCKGEGARRRGLTFARDFAAARVALAETAETMQLMAAGEPLPLDALRDIAGHVERLERGGVLDAPALADIRVSLQHAGTIRRFLGARRDKTPALWRAAEFDPSLDQLEKQLGGAIEVDGTLRDEASEELGRLRREIVTLRERIIGRLQDVIDKHGDLLSDGYYTLREGRYVLPVRRDAHERLHGIVHGESSSGASIFVEPRAVIAHGNRLKMAEAEREREELRILSAISELVREATPQLKAAERSLNRLDLRSAAALLGRAYDGRVPELLEQARASLKAARHPTLALDMAVVPNDMAIEHGHGVVISGPNAGGKTVVLKTLGLCALMVRAGLPLPVGEDSAIGFFGSVLTEMGDEQSTATNLSTFSAHVSHVAEMLARADDRSLVLLDELATGTDPGEGAALACAVLDAFCARGAAVVVTTHYEALKAFAEHDPRLRSASVGFSTEHLTPTFELLLDVPGASSALSVAARFGLPPDVIAMAERMLPEQAREFERLARSLSDAVGQARSEANALATERRAAEAKRREYDQLLLQLREQSRRKVSREAEQLLGEVRMARSELETARSQLRQNDKREGFRAIESKVNEAAARVAVGSSIADAIREEAAPTNDSPPAVRVGSRVYVPRLRAEGVVAEPPQKTKVLVAVGAMKLWVELKDLRTPAAITAEPAPARLHAVSDGDVSRMPDNTLDVRGLRADDALAMLDSFIDRLYAGPSRVGYVVHGHGTGALRLAVREHLKNDLPFVRASRAADEADGGDAVTMFQLD